MREQNKLSAVGVSRLNEPGRYGDGGGLWLQVTRSTAKDAATAPKPAVTKSWLFRYMLGGSARQMGLGDIATFSLAEARDRARQARQQVKDGVDPINAKRERRLAQRAAEAKLVTFREAAEKYMAAHSAGWKSAKHAGQWEATLATYAYPTLSDLSVATIDVGHIIKIIEPIWSSKTETASRVRGRIEAVLDWSAARGFRDRNVPNPARWKGHLDHLLPAKTKVRKVRHQPAMPYADLPAFMGELRGRKGVSAAALEFSVLTAARTGEAIGARWDEIDIATRIWTVPAERMKSGREHRVPLSNRALAILAALPRVDDAEFVFPGASAGKPISNMAMLELLRGMNSGLTVHGFRSTFRDWAGEQTNYAREVAEAALAHVVDNKTEAAYARGTMFEKRRKLMTAWAAYCATAPHVGQVVSMNARR